QPQVVADQRLRGADAGGDGADRDRSVQAGQQHPQPGGVAEQPVGGGDGLDAGVVAGDQGPDSVAGSGAPLRSSAQGAGGSSSTSTVVCPMPNRAASARLTAGTTVPCSAPGARPSSRVASTWPEVIDHTCTCCTWATPGTSWSRCRRRISMSMSGGAPSIRMW